MTSPLEMMENLSFDTKTVPTSLAKDYLTKHEKLFAQIISTNTELNFDNGPVKASYSELPFIMKEIANKVTENSKLFAQLEYVERNIEPESVMAYDIPLLVNRLKSYSGKAEELNAFHEAIKLEDTHPLSILGFIVYHIHSDYTYLVIPSPKTIAVCHLFVSICKECGLEGVELSTSIPDTKALKLILPSYISCSQINIQPYSDVTLGTMAVLTERSDVDSAVACLIHATTNPMYPWKLRRILVQEPIYEKFIAALSFRTTLKDAQNCLKSFTFKQNTFLIDFFGSVDNKDVLVEAYRTSKELGSLMSKYQPSYLSLWSNDNSVINEISYNTTANVVWVNEYGVFDRTILGENFYSGRDFAYSHHEINNSEEYVSAGKIVKKLMSIKTKWQKLDLDMRKCVLKQHVKAYYGSESDELRKVLDFIQNFKIDSFVDVKDGVLCVSFKSAFKGVVVLHAVDFFIVIEALLLGNAVVSNGFTWLSDDSIPFIDGNTYEDYPWRQENVSYKSNHLVKNYKTGQWKVFLSYFGEIFAN